METFFTKLFDYIGARLKDDENEMQLFVGTLLSDANLFVDTFSPEQYQRLRTCYNTNIRPKCSAVAATVRHPFPGPSTSTAIEDRLAFLEQEHQNTRMIQASFVDLLREHRESFDAQLARLHASI